MTNTRLTTTILAIIMAAAPAALAGSPMNIPEPLKIEHRELHEELSAATRLPARTGEAARRVAELLHPHFVAEEEYALPQLGVLSTIAAGKEPVDARDAIAMSDRLKASLPRMLEEHKAIVGALDALETAARTEGHADVVRFAEKLKVHAQTEEQVFYPASILVGEYLKMAHPDSSR